jgi:hypothetical protein
MGYTNRVFTPTGITAANPIVVTIADHGFTDGQRVRFSNTIQFETVDADPTGMVQLEGRLFVVRFPTTNTFQLYDIYGNTIDGTNYTTFVNNGRVKCTQTGPDLNIGSEL